METPAEIVNQVIEHAQNAVSRYESGEMAWAAYECGQASGYLWRLVQLIQSQTSFR